jgi:amidase
MPLAHDPFNAFVAGPEDADLPDKSGALSDLTLAVKDIYAVKGQRTGGGNPQMLAEAKPAERTAPAVQALLDAGARFVGRTQTDELTFSLIGHNAHYPQPVNPAATDRVTGGSSSGSAAAVAGGLVDIATGSDTGGSVRAPASFCGLIGLRTTHGRISLEGTMPLAPSFDTFGWFARDAEIYERVGGVFFGETSSPSLRGEGKGQFHALRLAALDELVLSEAATEYRRMVRVAESVIGPSREAAPLSASIDDLYWTFRKLQSYEAWAVHGPFISAKDRGLGPGVKERFEFGRSITSETASEEAGKRAAFRAEFEDLLSDDGLLVLPTVPGAAPLKAALFDDQQAYRERALRLLCLSGLSGFPQITIPLGSVDGAPFGLSLIGPAGSDMVLIQLAREILKAKEQG